MNDSNSDSSGDSSTSDEKEDCNEEEQLCESMTEPRNDSFDGLVVLFQNKYSSMLYKRGGAVKLICDKVATANFSD